MINPISQTDIDAVAAAIESLDAQLAANAVGENEIRLASDATRTALSDALALADLYPAPTPEETALIDTQVAAALVQYRALENPPQDIVSLASSVLSWRMEVIL